MLDHVNIVQERLKGEEKTGCMVTIQRAAKTEGEKKREVQLWLCPQRTATSSFTELLGSEGFWFKFGVGFVHGLLGTSTSSFTQLSSERWGFRITFQRVGKTEGKKKTGCASVQNGRND